jgi:hypothetical protein
MSERSPARLCASDVTADLRRRLEKRYPGDRYASGRAAGWVLLTEVGDGAGFQNRGWTDALAMQTWPSRGLELLGFELKATRSDWLRELDNPAKNHTWQTRVNEWYLVAPTGVVKVDQKELPAGWGLMVPSGKQKLRITVRATSRKRPEKVDRELLAAVFRAARNRDEDDLNAVRRDLAEEMTKSHVEQLKKAGEKADEYRGQLDKIRDALGSLYMKPDELKRRATLLNELDEDRLRRTAAFWLEGVERIRTNIRELIGLEE